MTGDLGAEVERITEIVANANRTANTAAGGIDWRATVAALGALTEAILLGVQVIGADADMHPPTDLPFYWKPSDRLSCPECAEKPALVRTDSVIAVEGLCPACCYLWAL